MENKQKGVLIIGLGLVMFFAGVLVVSRYFDRSSEEKVGAVAVQKLSAIVPSPSQQPTEDPLVNVKPAPVWKNVCKNPSGGYEVKYPDEWIVVTAGKGIGESLTIQDCGVLKFSKEQLNVALFRQNNPESLSADQVSGIRVTVSSKERATQSHTWAEIDSSDSDQKKKYKEMIVDGEMLVWMGIWIMHHDNKQYEIEAVGNVPEELLREFLSTFKFLK